MLNQEVAENYLASRGATLWGRAYDVKDEDSRKQAAQWLLRELNGLVTYGLRGEAYRD